MLSYREALQRIGIAAGTPVSYLNTFVVKPKSVRTMIDWTFSPGAWREADSAFIDRTWTEECQGVAEDGQHWLFSSNGSQPYEVSPWVCAAGGAVVGGLLGGPLGAAAGAVIGGLICYWGEPEIKIGSNPRALYFFDLGAGLTDENVKKKVVFDDIVPPAELTLHHIGNFDAANGQIFVSHFNDAGGQVIVLDHDGNFLEAVELQARDGGRFELQAVLPDGRFLNSKADVGSAFFLHDAAGSLVLDPAGNPLQLNIQTTVDANTFQGSSCSPNGKVYVATNMTQDEHQLIFVVSLLNGFVFGTIAVAAFKDNILVKDELEGIRFFPGLTSKGSPAQLWAVLLENQRLPRDNIFFKAFACDDPAHA